MINNNTVRNTQVSFPIIQGLINEHALGKILIKNVYQGWQGENIKQIKNKHEDNPYSLRIGMPSTDEQMKSDSMFFIQHYLSYNPLTKDIEKRELVPYRNSEKVYIGQSIDEKVYKDYRLFVDGNVVVGDIYLKNYNSIKDIPIGQIITNLVDKVEKLQKEVIRLKQQQNNKHIYTQKINK